MRCGIGFFVHVNFMGFGKGHAEFLLYCLFGIRDQARAKLAVFGGS